jgi:hypothetical protein
MPFTRFCAFRNCTSRTRTTACCYTVGFSFCKVEVILARDGRNVITAPLEPPTWVRFSKNLFGGFSLLLWLGALLSFAHYSIETGLQAEAASENLVLGTVGYGLSGQMFFCVPIFCRLIEICFIFSATSCILFFFI